MYIEKKKIYKCIYLILKKKKLKGVLVIIGKYSFEILKVFEKGKNLIIVMKVMIYLIIFW